MKKITTLSGIIAMVSMPLIAAGQGGFTGPSVPTQKSGYKDPNAAVTTVTHAKSLPDDSRVILRGKITKRVSDDMYKFQDATGVIDVDIDQKRWNGLSVSPQDTVEIQGEVDKDWNSVEIDVKHLRKIVP
ncbi:YgiW/YdeI family stress tolerance OB fold protein [Snodgrassella alvi]|uniref:TIGR00156 family protein n=1 Tax=Snodgrassella alvi TaxID=1196083 RepID=A0A2N9X730_9NEIS|nr:YgiW/YdeI family stress tolerance OB fold protein [Snodgrassella alvi]PIT39444.1 TIGR00156 family protein [Snodgrassella alvi]